MKRILLLMTVLMFLGVGYSVAGNAGLFDFNPEAIQCEMAELDQLESFVTENQGVTLDQMMLSGNPLAALITKTGGVSEFNLANDRALGIPGFIWGCCLSWVGIVVVYLVADDPKETKMAIIGCVVSALLSGVSYGGYYIYWGTSYL